MIDTALVTKAVQVPLDEVSFADHMMTQDMQDNGMDGAAEELQVKFRQVYYSRCAAADAMMGLVLAQFERYGDVDNTYTLFVSDHGEDNTEHRMTGKFTMYEASARVPMILTGPGISPGTLVQELAR